MKPVNIMTKGTNYIRNVLKTFYLNKVSDFIYTVKPVSTEPTGGHIQIRRVNLTKTSHIGTLFKVWFRQVPFYSGFSLDRFHYKF